MKLKELLLIISMGALFSCTSADKLAYLNNLPETEETQYFPMEVPDYRVQPRDILYITVKALSTDGTIRDMLQGPQAYNQSAYIRDESSQYLIGFTVGMDGKIRLPVIGDIAVADMTVDEIRELLAVKAEEQFNNTYVECKLISFKYTVLGEVKMPGTYINYNNYLTVLEAIGRAGGVGDYGRRDRVLVVRPTEEGSQTYRINLQDKNLLSSEAYFLLPNDVVIIQPVGHKIFNMNLPTFSFIFASVTSTISTTLLLINFLKN